MKLCIPEELCFVPSEFSYVVSYRLGSTGPRSHAAAELQRRSPLENQQAPNHTVIVASDNISIYTGVIWRHRMWLGATIRIGAAWERLRRAAQGPNEASVAAWSRSRQESRTSERLAWEAGCETRPQLDLGMQGSRLGSEQTSFRGGPLYIRRNGPF